MTEDTNKAEDRRLHPGGFRRIGEVLAGTGLIRLDRLNEAHAAVLDDLEARPRHPVTRGIE